MSPTDLKLFFRQYFKVVAGGPQSGLNGITRAEGILAVLDKLVDELTGNAYHETSFAAVNGPQPVFPAPADVTAYLGVFVGDPEDGGERLFLGPGYTVDSSLNLTITSTRPQLGDRITIQYLTGPVSAGGGVTQAYVDAADAGLQAQVNALKVSTAAGTVLVFTQDHDYPPITSGTFTVNLAGAKPGVVVQALLGPAATEPALPAGLIRLSGQYVAGQRHLYSFWVSPDGTIFYHVAAY